MKKVRVFLGGFINYTNAQNLNCRSLAIHLDKAKFEVFTLKLYNGNLTSLDNSCGINIFNCLRPTKISVCLGFLWGIWNCDVAYLPKSELWRFNRFLLRILKKKSFKTIEGILDEENINSAIEILKSYKNVISEKSYVYKSFAITRFLGEYNQNQHSIKVEPYPLYLGCEIDGFINKDFKRGLLKKIVYIGRLKKRKGIYDFLIIAKQFPQIDFYVFGDGEEKNNIEAYLRDHEIGNLRLMGVVNHSILADFLKETDLHILPSRSEGFPKVTLETASAGVPSIVYGDYGAGEWITHNENGWVTHNVGEITEIIQSLIEDPFVLSKVAKEAVELAKSFDWKIKVKDWENAIIEISMES
jgi:glycosyltransferase involved in cell wall biosynthesis